MRYEIKPQASQHVITDTANPLYVLRAQSLSELQALYVSIGEYLTQNNATEWMSTAEAREIAEADGKDLPFRTLNNACKRGTIPNARLQGDRWIMPKSEFKTWYNAWKSKKGTQSTD